MTTPHCQHIGDEFQMIALSWRLRPRLHSFPPWPQHIHQQAGMTSAWSFFAPNSNDNSAC